MNLRALLCFALAAHAFGQITLNEGVAVAFGEDLQQVSVRLREKPYEIDRRRGGMDMQIAMRGALIDFDTGRLWRVVLNAGYFFPKPLTPFTDEWKNFSPIGGQELAQGMAREDFMAYLAAWKQRAAAAGKRENTDYWIKETGSAGLGARVTVAMGPRRRLVGTGELTGDTWVIAFTGTTDNKYNPRVAVGALNEITISCDEFSTQRREPADGAPGTARLVAPRVNGRPLAKPEERGGAVMLDDGRSVAFGAPLKEVVEKLDLPSQMRWVSVQFPGIDREIAAPTALLEFDTERLSRVIFEANHEYVHPVRVFAEAWQNPDPIGGLRLKRGLTARELNAYLEAWRKRAIDAGKRERRDFWLFREEKEGREEFWTSFAPQRFTGDGSGWWGDHWFASLMPTDGETTSTLKSLTVLMDAFNTTGRPKPGMRDPGLAGVTLEDGTELYFGQAKAEVELLIGASAKSNIRPSGSQNISLREVAVSFDSDRLSQIAYIRLNEPPAPFPELWKNFTPIGSLKIAPGMSKEVFLEYLSAWEKRAALYGKVRGKHFNVQDSPSERSVSVSITMQSSRMGVNGGSAGDFWGVAFMLTGDQSNRRIRLSTITAARGEFNSRPPSAAAQRRESVKEMSRDTPAIELPAIELKLPTPENLVPKE